jgi:hypothetical protein
MPFAVGYAFERIADKRQAVVSKIRENGRAALLRFLDDEHEEWFLWPDFLNSAKWVPIGTKEAAN